MEKWSLRILYTVNGSPYILARSLTPVEITLFPSTPTSSRASGSIFPKQYGMVSLKTCLETLRRSSPDLMQGGAQNLSLYALDPLEAAEQYEQASTSTIQLGLPVAIGSLSWAMAAEESRDVPVHGTLVTQRMGQEALEVVLMLNQVRYHACISKIFSNGHRIRRPYHNFPIHTRELRPQCPPHLILLGLPKSHRLPTPHLRLLLIISHVLFLHPSSPSHHQLQIDLLPLTTA